MFNVIRFKNSYRLWTLLTLYDNSINFSHFKKLLNISGSQVPIL